MAWALPKSLAPHSTTRNKIKRWGRGFFKKANLEVWLLLVFLKKEKGFYKSLKRKDFYHVFERVIKRIAKKKP